MRHDSTHLTYMINDHWRLRPMAAAEAPIDAKSRAEALPPWQFQQRPMPTYKLREWWSLEHGLGSWDNGGRDHFWMFSCFSLLFFSSLDLGPVQMASAQVFTTCWWKCSFPVRRIRRMVAIELDQSVAEIKISYEHVRSMNVWCFNFVSFSLVRSMQPRRSAPEQGDNVTTTCDCGRVTAILYSRLMMRLGSLVIILPIHLFALTRVHVCNRIHSITIRMPTRPNAGVRAITLSHSATEF